MTDKLESAILEMLLRPAGDRLDAAWGTPIADRFATFGRAVHVTPGGWVVIERLGTPQETRPFEVICLISGPPAAVTIGVGDVVEPFNGVEINNVSRGICLDARREGDEHASLAEARAEANRLEADYHRRYPSAP